jgi:hypothetical protein
MGSVPNPDRPTHTPYLAGKATRSTPETKHPHLPMSRFSDREDGLSDEDHMENEARMATSKIEEGARVLGQHWARKASRIRLPRP